MPSNFRAHGGCDPPAGLNLMCVCARSKSNERRNVGAQSAGAGKDCEGCKHAKQAAAQVAEAGSVVVERLMDVERYSHVMHISSTVTGRLARHLDAWDALRAALPAGTVSGAPKVPISPSCCCSSHCCILLADVQPSTLGRQRRLVPHAGERRDRDRGCLLPS